METPLLIAQLRVLQSASGVCPPFIGNHVELIDNYLLSRLLRHARVHIPHRGGAFGNLRDMGKSRARLSRPAAIGSAIPIFLLSRLSHSGFPRVRLIAR
jgi:hypothetical protein